jgi:hypothetical protein
MHELLKQPMSRNALVGVGIVLAACVLGLLYSHATRPQINPVTILAQSAESLKAALQDKDPRFVLKHAAEGRAYLSIARKLASDSSLQSSGYMPHELEKQFETLLADPA